MNEDFRFAKINKALIINSQLSIIHWSVFFPHKGCIGVVLELSYKQIKEMRGI
jgi:hypothetical protein